MADPQPSPELSEIPSDSVVPPPSRPRQLSPRTSSGRKRASSPSLPQESLQDEFRRRKRVKMSSGEKATLVLKLMREHWRWSLKELIQTITEHKDMPIFSKPHAGYIKEVFEALRQKGGIREFIPDAENARDLYHDILGDCVGYLVRKELRDLEKTPSFGQCSDSNEEDIQTAIGHAVQILERTAPLFLSFIRGATKESRGRGRNTNDYPVDGRHVIMAAILSNVYHHDSFVTIQSGLGLYLYGNGVRSRAIDMFCKLGVSRSSDFIAKKYAAMQETGESKVRALSHSNSAVFAYDNFEFTVGRRGERVGDRKTFHSITTALVTKGRLIPEEGLTQSMWRPDVCMMEKDFYRYTSADAIFELVSCFLPHS